MNFVEVFKKFDYSGQALNFIIENSESMYSPYHNLNHNISITIFSYFNAVSEKIDKKQMKELLLASIFHDFNHTAGESNGVTNIKNAKLGVKEFVSKNKINVDLNTINKNIDATEFPYKISDEDLDIQQKIIRDSDILQLVEPNRLQSNCFGLQKTPKKAPVL